MSYAQFHDGFYRNAKVKRAGNMAGWMWVASIGYANENLTDGFIPAEALNELSELDSKPRAKLAAKLVDVGLWEKADGGWMIHDFLKWNFTREQVLAKRAANLARVNKHRAGNGDGNSRVMRYNGGDTSRVNDGDQLGESAPSSGPLDLRTSEIPSSSPTPSQQPASVVSPDAQKADPTMTKTKPPVVPVAPPIDPESTDPTDILNALAASSDNVFDPFSGAGTDAEVQFQRRLANYGFNVRRIQRLGPILAKHATTMPKMWVKSGEKIRMSILMGPSGPNGQRGGTWLSVAVGILEAAERVETQKATRAAAPTAAPARPLRPENIPGTPEYAAAIAKGKADAKARYDACVAEETASRPQTAVVQ